MNQTTDNVNDITNELILKYDSKFNENYNKILDINSSIMNKEELIVKENDEITRKEKNIISLQILVIFIIVFGVLLVMYANKKINIKQLFAYAFGLFIFYILSTWYATNYLFYDRSVADRIKEMRIAMADYVMDENVDLTCPSNCPSTATNPPDATTITGYASPTLRTDPQLNVWELGDMPTDLYTSKTNPGSKFYTNPTGIPNYADTPLEELTNEPKPFFKALNPVSTYYKCNWLGGNSNNGGLPNPESNKYSSIPCSYRPNFEEVGKYVCTKNPNNLSDTDFNSYCDDVTTMI
jgi:hypothetical protein